jgi:hypothetical protein
MKKTYTNHFMPGLFDLTRDYCEMSESNSTTSKFMKTLLSNIHPMVWAATEKLIRPCPYKVWLMAHGEREIFIGFF